MLSGLRRSKVRGSEKSDRHAVTPRPAADQNREMIDVMSILSVGNGKTRSQRFWERLRRQWMLQVILLIGFAYLIIFAYIPMVGIIIGFKSYKLSSGLAGFFTSKWVGLKWFEEFVTDYSFGSIVRNTLVISLLKLLICFPLPILFAILLNEMQHSGLKRIVQTVSYLPHFISWIIVVGICSTMFNSYSGLINELFENLGWIQKPLAIMVEGKYYYGLAVLSEAWKETGWNAIIFIAAIAGIEPTLYEAAKIDGATRMQRIRFVTLPGIRGTVVVMLILALGSLVNGNLEQARLMGNTYNRDYSDIIQSYVLRVGLNDLRFDYAAAVGLMQSVISVILVFASNTFCRRKLHASLY
jgi:putative aldouronate transport system permease protein